MKWDRSIGTLEIDINVTLNFSNPLGTKTITGSTRIPIIDSTDPDWDTGDRTYALTILDGTVVGSTDFVNIIDSGSYKKFGTSNEVVLKITQLL